jgi:peptide/nickel transport system substrate-binding protein
VQVFETLVVHQGSEVVPRLAESWEVGKDGTSVTFKLREGVTFHDGSELDAEDVKFSFDQARDEEVGDWASTFSAVTSVEATDDLTVVVTTDRPHAPLLASMAFPVLSIIPSDYGGKSQEEFFKAPVGTGPFTWAKLSKDGGLRLEKNDDYWQEGLPYLDSITYRVAPEANSRVLQLKAGEGQMILNGVDREVRAALQGDPTFEVASYPSTEVTYIAFNHNVKPFDDVHVRRAIIHATNRQGYLEAFEDPGAPVAGSFMPNTDPAYIEIEPYAYDVELAKAELAQSSVPDGFTVQFKVPDYDAELAEAVQQDLAKIGITVEIVVREEDTYYDELYELEYEMGTIAWVSDYLDPDQPMQYMINPDGGIDAMFTSYDNPELVELIERAAVELDAETRNELYATVQRQAHEDAYLLPIGYAPMDAAYSKAVRGFDRSPLGESRMELVWLAQ